MKNTTSINLTLSQRFTQSQETILVLPNQLQTLHAQINSKKIATEKPATNKKKIINKSKRYFWNHIRTRNLDHARLICNCKKEGHQVTQIAAGQIAR